MFFLSCEKCRPQVPPHRWGHNLRSRGTCGGEFLAGQQRSAQAVPRHSPFPVGLHTMRAGLGGVGRVRAAARRPSVSICSRFTCDGGTLGQSNCSRLNLGRLSSIDAAWRVAQTSEP